SLLLLQYLTTSGTTSTRFLGPLMAPHAISRTVSRMPLAAPSTDRHVRFPDCPHRDKVNLQRGLVESRSTSDMRIPMTWLTDMT
ncbi:hypothetical protein GW17_00061876, partial [Ensete ventricosum]